MKPTLFFFLALAVLAAGCKDHKFEKPFIVIHKYKVFGSQYYTYQDRNGWRINFNDNEIKYQIGDTIK